MGDELDIEMGGGEGRETTPPGSIARALTEEDLEQKTWLTQLNKEGIYEILAYNKYLEEYTGLRDRILDNLVECACTFGKSLDGQNIASIVNLAGAIHQQPSSNINIGESFTKKLGGT